jgi:hypothetical protein
MVKMFIIFICNVVGRISYLYSVYDGHNPAGSSLKTAAQFAQNFNAGINTEIIITVKRA